MKRPASEGSNGQGSPKRPRSHSQSDGHPSSSSSSTAQRSRNQRRSRSRTKSHSPRVAGGKGAGPGASSWIDQLPGWFARLPRALFGPKASTSAPTSRRTTPSLNPAPSPHSPTRERVRESPAEPSTFTADGDYDYEPITDGRGETKDDAISINSDDSDIDDTATQRDDGLNHQEPDLLPVAGPSRLHARRIPSRPDLSETYVARRYIWEEDPLTLPSDGDDSAAPPRRPSALSLRKPRKIQKPRTATLTIRQKFKGIMGEAERMRGRGYARQLARTFLSGGARAMEQEFKQQASKQGADDQVAYRRFLDRKIPQPRSQSIPGSTPRATYNPSLRRSAAYVDTFRNVEDILERFTLEDQQREADVQARLDSLAAKRPSPPDALKPAQKEIVAKAFSDRTFKRTAGQSQVEAKSIARLKPGTWLDDEIINHYGALLQLRSDKARADGAKTTLPNVHVFNSFFYKKLVDDGYSRMLSRWTKKFDIFAKDLVLFPINLSNVHWTAGAFDLRAKRVYYFDSMGATPGKARELLGLVCNYLEKEYKDKKGGVYDTSDWEVCIDRDAPQQDNGNDCGVFSCQTLEGLARGLSLAPESVGGGSGSGAKKAVVVNGSKTRTGRGEWEFGSENMEFMRQMMVWEISEGRLMERW